MSSVGIPARHPFPACSWRSRLQAASEMQGWMSPVAHWRGVRGRGRGNQTRKVMLTPTALPGDFSGLPDGGVEPRSIMATLRQAPKNRKKI